MFTKIERGDREMERLRRGLGRRSRELLAGGRRIVEVTRVGEGRAETTMA